MLPVILASGSPRRRDYLKTLGLEFTIIRPTIDETARPGESPRDLVTRLCRLKAAQVAAAHPEAVVIAADTVVTLDGEIFGKPRDAADARAMIGKLSGRTHEVFSGLEVRAPARTAGGAPFEEQVTVRTAVTFAPLSTELIAEYVATGESFDKSGSYAVQGLSAMFVEKVEGSVTSVVGLPLCQLREILTRLGLPIHPVRPEAR